MTTEPTEPPNSWTTAGIFWTILRLAGIVVGVATMLRLATIGFNIEFNEIFQAFLDRMRAFFELDAIIDVVEVWLVIPCITFLRDLGWTIPDLQTHWRQVFTLEWLFLAAFARNYSVSIVAQFLWAGACALLAAAAAGTQPLASPAVALWPLAGMCLFIWGLFSTRRLLAGSPQGIVASLPVLAALLAFGGLLMNEALPDQAATLPLTFLAAVVALLGLVALSSFFEDDRTWWERLVHPETFASIGLDILSVMCLALGITYLMMK